MKIAKSFLKPILNPAVKLTSLGLSVSLLFSHNVSADAAAGKQVYNQCAGCHAIGPDAAHRFGPHLNGIMERGAATASGYDYSGAFAAKASEGLTWDNDTMDAFLKAPMQYVAGTKMAYPGLQSEDDRRNVIAYLATINPDGSVKGEEKVEEAAVVDKQATEPRPLAADVPIPTHGVLHLGRQALPEEVAAWDIDIRPDGLGLPEGSGNAITGGELYDAQCASCHGVFGEGEGRWPILAGGHDTLTDERPEKTIGSYWPYLSTVYDYVRRAMPFGNVRSLSDDDVYAITAYLLYLNDHVDDDFELSSENFTSVSLPNEENFFPDDRSSESWFESGEEPCMTDCIPGTAKVAQRARVLDVTPDSESSDNIDGVD